MNLLAQAIPPPSFWNAEQGSAKLWFMIAIAFVIGMAAVFGIMQIPLRYRRPILVTVTFLGGLFWVLVWLFPQPINRVPDELPRDHIVEKISFFLDDMVSVVGNFSNVLGGTIFGLGIFSLLHLHTRRFIKMQKDWFFSMVLILSMFIMVLFGYWDWILRKGEGGEALQFMTNWSFANYAKDLLFDGMLQQMDSVMFSMIAFFILSAAYRAFRIRSIESTILLATALLVMLSIMGAVDYQSTKFFDGVTHNDPASFLNNLKLSEISGWLKDTIQVPSLRAIDFGIGVGTLAMSLRIWLSLEKGGIN